jgi:hypothetical protein
MIAGRVRDAVVAAVATLAPESVRISSRADTGWRIVFRPARFERASLSNSGRGLGQDANSPQGLATRLVRDISGLLSQSQTWWPNLSSSSATSEVLVSDDGLQVILSDDAGHQASSSLVPLWTTKQRQARVRARADLARLAQPGAPAPARYLSLQLTKLLLADDGHLRHDAWAKAAIRVAAFCDLTLLDRFRLVDGAWELDPEPTQVTHLDRLIDALARGEGRDLDEWIGSGPDLLALSSQYLISEGTWRRHTRRLPGASPAFASVGDLDNAGADAIKLALNGILHSPSDTTPQLATLTGCAIVARTIRGQNLATQDLIDAAGPPADVLAAGLEWAARGQQAETSGLVRPIGDAGPMSGYWGQ